ncbi:MAG: glycosyltransferase family 4 protein [Chloroflexi bacterium]|nr:glycosyltransferase family 4 protein [Chloroflexota bacterium]
MTRREHRVLVVAPTTFFADYGCHVRILEEARAIAERGGRVVIATYPGGQTPDGLQVERPNASPWGNAVRVGSSYHRIYLDLLLLLKAIVTAMWFRPTIVHAHLHEGALIGWCISRLWRVPVVFDFQGSLTSEMIDHGYLRPTDLTFRPLRWVEREICRRSDAILTSSDNAVDVLVRTFGVARERITAVPDAADATRFRPRWLVAETQREAGRAALKLPAGRRIVAYLGLLAEYQGTSRLLRAAAAVRAVREDVHFLVMGFPGVETYSRQARDLGIADAVTFTGRVPYARAPELLTLADVAVAPKLSATEGNGKLLNYMAVGLPTVAYDRPVNREILGEEGVFADPSDEASLANAILQLLADPDAPNRGRRLRERVEREFSWSEVGATILSVYARVSHPLATERCGSARAPSRPRRNDQSLVDL